jgi:hypothetical protein
MTNVQLERWQAIQSHRGVKADTSLWQYLKRPDSEPIIPGHLASLIRTIATTTDLWLDAYNEKGNRGLLPIDYD